jgi:molybdenum-dependent DNA-binding transcriptional regulator ModE
MSKPSELAMSVSALERQIQELQKQANEAIAAVQSRATNSVEKLKEEADEAIAGLKSQAAQPPNKPRMNVTLVCAVIAAIASLISGSITAYTNLMLSRTNTLLTEKAKSDIQVYATAEDHIARLESAFETILVTQTVDRKDKTPAELSSDLHLLVTGNRLGSATEMVRAFNDYINETIASLQNDKTQFQKADELRKTVQQKKQAAIEALQKLEQGH